MLFNPKAGFALAQSLQRGEPHAVAEIFSFLSGLYFRGKCAYAKAFARPPRGKSGGWVITPSRGLLPLEEPIQLAELREFASVPIDEDEPRYTGPLRAAAARLAAYRDTEFVLLGSISTGKYVTVLLEALGDRLLFPSDFVGRGDMSRGGLLLRSVRDEAELSYTRVRGALLRGARPPKLAPQTWVGTPWDLRAPKGAAPRRRA